MWWRLRAGGGCGLEQLSLLLGHTFTLGGDVAAHYLWEFLCTLPPTRRVSLLPLNFPGSCAAAAACAEQAMLCCCCCWVRWRHPETQALDSLSVGITSQLTSAKPCQQRDSWFRDTLLYSRCQTSLIGGHCQVPVAPFEV